MCTYVQWQSHETTDCLTIVFFTCAAHSIRKLTLECIILHNIHIYPPDDRGVAIERCGLVNVTVLFVFWVPRLTLGRWTVRWLWGYSCLRSSLRTVVVSFFTLIEITMIICTNQINFLHKLGARNCSTQPCPVWTLAGHFAAITLLQMFRNLDDGHTPQRRGVLACDATLFFFVRPYCMEAGVSLLIFDMLYNSYWRWCFCGGAGHAGVPAIPWVLQAKKSSSIVSLPLFPAMASYFYVLFYVLQLVCLPF